MGSVNLDNTGSGSAITLSSDGTSLLLNGTAIGGGGGGADLYIANPVSATDPTAAGDNAVGIGDGADATGNDSISIGTGTIAGLESVAIGLSAASGTTTGSYNTSIGRSAAVYLTTGSNNTAVGRSALQGSNLDKVTGSGNAAIGYGAGSKNAGGNNNTYLGTDAGNAITSGSSNTFIGHNADGAATTSQQTALGYQAQTAGTEAIAIGNSKASGIGTFAAQIGTNSSSYGAIGNSGTAIGGLTKTTGLDFVFGRSSIASGGSGSLSLGMDNTSSGAGAVTLGKDNTASHTDAVVIGQGASSSAADQITLGHTDQTVRISSAYTLPTSDGTNGQVLTTDGSGAVTFATASGGGGASAQTIDIKTADYTVVSGDLGKIIKYFGAGADRTVTLTAGATLGEGFHVTILNANSGADERVVIDANSTEKFGWSNGPQTITLSRGELVRIIWDNTGGRWIIGEGGFNLGMRSDINPATTTAAGDGANGAIALGHNSLATGSQAVSLGRSLASNSYAFAASIGNNTSSYGASGSGSAAIMNYAKASSSNSGAFGFGANATNSMAYAFGAQTFATGNSSVSLGRNSLASATYSICIGNAGQNNIQSSIKFSGSQHANQGDAQIGL